MLEELVLSKTISLEECKAMLPMFTKSLNAGTPAFFPRKDTGISYLSLWVPVEQNDWLYPVGTVNATIIRHTWKDKQEKEPNISGILQKLDGILSKYNLTQPWLIHRMSFKSELDVSNAGLYIKLLGRTDPSSLSKLGKGVKIYNTTGQLRGYEFSNGITKAVICYESGSKLSIRVTVRGRDGLKHITKDLFVRSRIPEDYVGKLQKVEDYFIKHTLNAITGEGDYLSLSEAEKCIDMFMDISHKECNKYMAVLEGIRRYRGMENFLRHMDDPESLPEEYGILKKRTIAERMIKGLRKHGINPLTIPIREEQAGIRMLPNLGKCRRT